MNSQTKKRLPAAAWILVGMALGILIGYMIFISFPDKKTAAQIAGYISIVSDVFLRLIKMLIGPLVFSTLVVGIAHMGDAASVGRVFAKAATLQGWPQRQESKSEDRARSGVRRESCGYRLQPRSRSVRWR